jgi:hypothetical protein
VDQFAGMGHREKCQPSRDCKKIWKINLTSMFKNIKIRNLKKKLLEKLDARIFRKIANKAN